MGQDSADEVGKIEPGDFVYLALSETGTDLAALHPLRDTYCVLVGAGHVSRDLEQELIGQSIGDSGLIELPNGRSARANVPPTSIEDVVPESIAPVLINADITTPWEFVDADPEQLAAEHVLDAERLAELHAAAADRLSDSRLVEYTVLGAYRWQDSPSETEGGSPTDQQRDDAEFHTISTPDEWRTFKRNNARQGTAGGAGTMSTAGITERWFRKEVTAVGGAAAVADGTVYIGSKSGQIFALDAATGEDEWSQSIGTSIKTSPVVADSTVYVCRHDNIFAFDAEAGEEIWANQPGGIMPYAPSISDGRVYCVGWDSPDLVRALDATTGDENWEFQIDEGARGSPAVGEDTVYVGDTGGYLYALDATEGTERWKQDIGSKINSSPALGDNTLYVCGERGLFNLNAEDGEVLWSLDIPGISDVWTPAVFNNTVVFADERGRVISVDAETGELRWNKETEGRIRSSPAVNGDTVFVGSDDGHLYGIDLETGEQRWRYFIGSRVQMSPTVIGRTLYIGSDGIGFHALRV